jgi:hypothetical protein
MGQIRYQYTDKDGQRSVKEIHKVVVHRFNMGDVEDPDLYAAQPIYEWQESEAGKFVLENAVETPIWQRQHDNVHYGWQYVIIAELEKKKLSEFYLRFDKDLKI